MKNLPLSRALLKDLPVRAGVYVFKNADDEAIYIGKAKNLKSRLTSYFGVDLAPKTSKMLTSARTLSFIEVASEFEALLLEAKMVREKLPKYNIQLRDDKSPLYIVITKDKFPRLLAVRKTQLELFKTKKVYGPFLESQTVRKVLRMLRRIFPYSTHLPAKKICIYKELGLCDPCPSEIRDKLELRKKYLKNIKNISGILSGKIMKVKRDLEKEMNSEAKKENFENAQKIQNQLKMLDYITAEREDPGEYLADPNLIEDIRAKELSNLTKILSAYLPIGNLIRIECFDVARLGGTSPTASMVTFVNGEPDKNFYRYFKVKIDKKRSDIDSLKSIFERRTRYFDGWGKPDLIIVDGGKPQVSAAIEILNQYNIPIIGLAKRFETIVIKINDKQSLAGSAGKFIEIRPKGPALNLLQRIRNEAHRFARQLHHRQIAKSMLN